MKHRIRTFTSDAPDPISGVCRIELPAASEVLEVALGDNNKLCLTVRHQVGSGSETVTLVSVARGDDFDGTNPSYIGKVVAHPNIFYVFEIFGGISPLEQ